MITAGYQGRERWTDDPHARFSTTQDGELVLYPMKTPNRRAERREDIVKYVEQLHGRAPANAAGGGKNRDEGKTRKELVVVDLTEAGTNVH